VAAAPQFHENHVLGGSLAFNLLMGRRWPATLADYDEADWVCRRLGLGLLLDRMPAGLRQQVGESGWQLSHGERSRLFIARAVLQGAPVVVLDESLGALDPEAHLETLVALDELVDALVLVAH
jgi:ATP-binding cassette subfamily B protein